MLHVEQTTRRCEELKPSHMKALSIFFIIASLAFGGAYYWGTVTLVADTTPPVINEAASTSGAIAYGTGRPTVILFVDENTGIESATAELKHSTGFQTSIETIDLDFIKKMDSDTYKYKSTFTTQLDQNIKYTLIYRVHDQADHSDTWSTTLTTVNLDGTVYVNGKEVKNPGDTIYVTTLQLTIAVAITQSDSVSSIYGMVNGVHLTFTQGAGSGGSGGGGSDTNMDSWLASVSSDAWVAEYLLPGDGSYAFMVLVTDTAGVDTQLASFNIELGGQYQTELIIGVFAALALASLVFLSKKSGWSKAKPGAKK